MKSILILNCSLLGPNEVAWWNSFYEAHGDNVEVFFFTTDTNAELAFPNVIQISYHDILSCADAALDDGTDDLLSQVAEYDKIWECYDPVVSKAKARSWYAYWQTALAVCRPAAVYSWNGYNVPEVALARAADLAGIATFHLERGPFARTFVCDKKGFNFSGSFISDYDKIDVEPDEERVRRFRQAYFKGGVSNWEQPELVSERDAFFDTLGIPKDKLLLFFPSQLDRDANSKLFNRHFSSVYEALASTASVLEKHADRVFLLAKKHPKQEDDTERYAAACSRVGKWIEDAHIFDCIAFADAVISINSAVAVEAALCGKPTLILGSSILQPNEAVLKLTDRETFDETIDDLLSLASGRETRIDPAYFSKLLFGYLFSAEPEYVELGLKRPSDFPVPRDTGPADDARRRCAEAITSFMQSTRQSALLRAEYATLEREYERYKYGYERLASSWANRAWSKLKGIMVREKS